MLGLFNSSSTTTQWYRGDHETDTSWRNQFPKIEERPCYLWVVKLTCYTWCFCSGHPLLLGMKHIVLFDSLSESALQTELKPVGTANNRTPVPCGIVQRNNHGGTYATTCLMLVLVRQFFESQKLVHKVTERHTVELRGDVNVPWTDSFSDVRSKRQNCHGSRHKKSPSHYLTCKGWKLVLYCVTIDSITYLQPLTINQSISSQQQQQPQLHKTIFSTQSSSVIGSTTQPAPADFAKPHRWRSTCASASHSIQFTQVHKLHSVHTKPFGAKIVIYCDGV